jgi:hypothetical protein
MKSHGKVTRSVATLVALAASSIAFANHEEGHGNKQGPGPKLSVNVTNTCTVVADTCTGCWPDHVLLVTTEIKNASDDPEVLGEVTPDKKTVGGQQRIKNLGKGKKLIWTDVGMVEQSDTIPNPVEIHLCQQPTLSPNAKALNAEVTVEVGGRVFYSRCDDNPDNNVYDPDTGKLLEEFDESIVLPVDEDGDPISCAAQ